MHDRIAGGTGRVGIPIQNFVPGITANKSSNLIDTAAGMQARVATR